jgi:transcriptional regulator GlxA family with amidase domain
MERAAHLLENSFLMVKEISAIVGAGDVSHFVKDFEKQYGMSPARYRQQFSDEKIKKIEENFRDSQNRR